MGIFNYKPLSKRIVEISDVMWSNWNPKPGMKKKKKMVY